MPLRCRAIHPQYQWQREARRESLVLLGGVGCRLNNQRPRCIHSQSIRPSIHDPSNVQRHHRSPSLSFHLTLQPAHGNLRPRTTSHATRRPPNLNRRWPLQSAHVGSILRTASWTDPSRPPLAQSPSLGPFLYCTRIRRPKQNQSIELVFIPSLPPPPSTERGRARTCCFPADGQMRDRVLRLHGIWRGSQKMERGRVWRERERESERGCAASSSIFRVAHTRLDFSHTHLASSNSSFSPSPWPT